MVQQGVQTQAGMLFVALCLHMGAATAGMLKVDMTSDGNGGGGDTISHSLTLVQRLEALLLQGNGSDLSLRVETPSADEVKVIQAHSLVLSLQSPVFEEILLSRNSSKLVLKESSDCAAVFDKFIRYLYCGEISLRLDQATPLHKLATKYQVTGLQQGITQYMTQNLARESTSATWRAGMSTPCRPGT
ncbi:BTB/POZ domain containing protein 17 [Dissostichus eleginoides]|uniref:BTB/POZ domain containing protein 17 n=1 Tax=Dissostichus eleginoides TaxID=100907 RepID=A0AAD9BCN7_DISEL|nr:BTB/POZ domain containing protein 17 [Dissostichus eleginoides]